MTRFTRDNTDGYTAADLANLNAAYSVRIAELCCHGVDVSGDDIASKSLLDNVVERILADYDVQAES